VQETQEVQNNNPPNVPEQPLELSDPWFNDKPIIKQSRKLRKKSRKRKQSNDNNNEKIENPPVVSIAGVEPQTRNNDVLIPNSGNNLTEGSGFNMFDFKATVSSKAKEEPPVEPEPELLVVPKNDTKFETEESFNNNYEKTKFTNYDEKTTNNIEKRK